MPRSEGSKIESLHKRAASEGKIFWIDEQYLALLDPDELYTTDKDNFYDVPSPGKLRDVFASDKDQPSVYWRDVRAASLTQAHLLNKKPHLLKLYERMAAEIHRHTGHSDNLANVCQHIITRPLLPMVIHDISDSEYKLFVKEQDQRFLKMTGQFGNPNTTRKKTASFLLSYKLGRMARKIIRQRHKGIRSNAEDFTAGIISLMPNLQPGQAAYALTAITTAITGAPAPVAACLLCELLTKDANREDVFSELQGLTTEKLCESPREHAPKTVYFIKEVMRLWGFPALANRRVRANCKVKGNDLAPGQNYTVCMYSMHRDKDYWDHPEQFNPSRWADERQTAKTLRAFTPFGWGERTCFGASVGMSQLILFCHMFATKFSVILDSKDTTHISYHGPIAFPDNFSGTLSLQENAEAAH